MSPRVLMNADAGGRMLAHLFECFPEEGCGLLIGVADDAVVEVRDAVPSQNIADERERRFEIDPGLRLRTQRAARAEGLDVVGLYHSHPFGEPQPSSVDRERAALESDLVWLIAGLRWGGPQGLAAWLLPEGAEPRRLDLVIEEEAMEQRDELRLR